MSPDAGMGRKTPRACPGEGGTQGAGRKKKKELDGGRG